MAIQQILISTKKSVSILGNINPTNQKVGPFTVKHWSLGDNLPEYAMLKDAENRRDNIIQIYHPKSRK